MQKFTYYAPTEIVFGFDTESRTAELVRKYGGSRVLLICGGKSAEISGLLGRVTENLKAAGMEVLAMGGVVPNPLLSTAVKMAEEGKRFGADFVLAVGGGSVIDTAKAVAHAIASPEHEIWDFWTGTKVEKSLPKGAILTISAAGSGAIRSEPAPPISSCTPRSATLRRSWEII